MENLNIKANSELNDTAQIKRGKFEHVYLMYDQTTENNRR